MTHIISVIVTKNPAELPKSPKVYLEELKIFIKVPYLLSSVFSYMKERNKFKNLYKRVKPIPPTPILN